MARYVDDFQGISAQYLPPRGMDPNFRGPYGGMRMRGEPGQAAYGRYRAQHPEDFEGSGGVLGHYSPRRLYSGEYEAGYGSYRGYDRDWHGGGMRDLRRDPRAMREFNADSMNFRPESRGYDREHRPRRGEGHPGHGQGYRFGYADRGLSSGGYSEGWAWGPMRGAR